MIYEYVFFLYTDVWCYVRSGQYYCNILEINAGHYNILYIYIAVYLSSHKYLLHTGYVCDITTRVAINVMHACFLNFLFIFEALRKFI